MGENSRTDIMSNHIKLGSSPPPSSEATSKVMKANKSKGTKLELDMRKALRKIGLSGYRLNWKKVPGSPDITYPNKKIAIFVHGCFWHNCPYCKPSLPKRHKNFWKRKFELNRARDKQKRQELEKLRWKVFEFWGCQIKKNPEKYALEVRKYFQKTNQSKEKKNPRGIHI